MSVYGDLAKQMVDEASSAARTLVLLGVLLVVLAFAVGLAFMGYWSG